MLRSAAWCCVVLRGAACLLVLLDGGNVLVGWDVIFIVIGSVA